MVDTAHLFTISTYIKYATIPSTLILVILVLLQRRAQPNPCGYRYPALVIPMRFLDGYNDRWAYALSFGAIASILLSLIMQIWLRGSSGISEPSYIFCEASSGYNATSSSLCDQIWVKTLISQSSALVASLVCVPHFVCITTPYKLIGALLGFAYSVFWIIFYIVGAVRNELDYSTIVVDHVVEQHQVDHVMALFRPPPDDHIHEGHFQNSTGRAGAEGQDQDQISTVPHFKLPTRIICIASVQIAVIYYMGVSFTAIGMLLRQSLKSWLQADTATKTVFSIFDGVFASTMAVSLLSSAIYVVLFVVNYRINMISIYKGQKLQLYQEVEERSSSMHGFFIVFLVLFLVLGITAFGIYALQNMDLLVDVVKYLAQLLSVPLLSVVIFKVQVLLTKLFLLQPKVNEDDKDPPLNVDNRRLYEVVSYTLLFCNLMVGLQSALLRTLKSFLLGVLFLGRLDRCLMMKGFEDLDQGYMAYVDTLLVDNAHNNPSMRTFCALLLRLTCKTWDTEKMGITHLPEPERTCSNSQAARRWHLAYTLLKNPDLLSRRKLALLLTRSLEDDRNRSIRERSTRGRPIRDSQKVDFKQPSRKVYQQGDRELPELAGE